MPKNLKGGMEKEDIVPIIMKDLLQRPKCIISTIDAGAHAIKKILIIYIIHLGILSEKKGNIIELP